MISKLYALLISISLVISPLALVPAQAAALPPAGPAAVSTPIADQYIVTLKDDVTDISGVANALANANGGKLLHIYTKALHGFAVNIPAGLANALSKNPSVARVEQDATVQALNTEANATWGIDRIDQHTLPLSTSYSYDASGTGVNVYVIDTGIRATHSEFAGRVGTSYTSITDGNGTNDCNGHGTHVSGTIGGATYGVAKNVTLHAVRVLDCNGSGSWSGVIAGIDWVTANHVGPSVANMSLGGGFNQSINDAVEKSIASGVTYSIAAGNSSANACNYSPASAPHALTVGATQSNDAQAYYSNFGSCVDLYAPGTNITSSWNTSDTATNIISGTSMATPHVTGVAALYLETHPTATPAEVDSAVVGNGTTGVLGSLGAGSPNILLYSLFSSIVIPPVVSPTAPAITSFITSPSSILQGSSATLSWVVNNASSTTIDQGIGDVSSLSSIVVTPTQTTTYTLTATNPNGSVSSSVTVTVTVPVPFTISSSVSGITRNRATINWNTNFSSTGVVKILRNGVVIGTYNDTASATSHGVTFSGLSRNTSYTYTVNATRTGGTETASTNGSFRTSF